MDRKIRNLIILSLFLSILILVFLFFGSSKNENNSGFSMIDVGQGDSFLIQSSNGVQLLIDAGKDSKVLSGLTSVMPKGDRFIEVIIATHPDADHIGGIKSVLKHYEVGLFLTSQVSTDTETFKNLFFDLNKKNIPSYYARSGMDLTLNNSTSVPTKFSIIFPNRPTDNWETNNASIVGRLDIGQRSALFTGDSPANIEHFLVNNFPKKINVDILKLSHHGSKTGSSLEFLKSVSPNLVLISAGVKNNYGHPNIEIIERLKSLNIPIISTIEKGTTSFYTDGLKWYKSN